MFNCWPFVSLCDECKVTGFIVVTQLTTVLFCNWSKLFLWSTSLDLPMPSVEYQPWRTNAISVKYQLWLTNAMSVKYQPWLTNAISVEYQPWLTTAISVDYRPWMTNGIFVKYQPWLTNAISVEYQPWPSCLLLLPGSKIVCFWFLHLSRFII